MYSDSESDLELEVLEQLSDWDDDELLPAPRKSFTRINHLRLLNEAEFTFRFRINKTAVELLLSEIMPFIKVTSKRNNGVSPLHQLLLTLRFYALGTMLIAVGDFAGVSKSTACRIVQNISKSIAKLYNNFKIHSLAIIPNTYICTWIFISPIYLFFTAQCDIGTFGNRWLLGDSAYPNRAYLLTPVLNPSNSSEQKYNEAHIATRNLIERTFGVWKRRFPVIFLPLRLSLANVQAVIIATAVLHNICRKYNMQEMPSEVELPASLVTDPSVADTQSQALGLQDIVERNELINGYFSTL
ncbi:uncharacterized protein LOC123659460 [Melitaea cinxia]|uniref:uncharacterized protein LOC123659460 n=1 Tax=Melitaea cinxia TaxID=113334 RepID=UPI001E26EEE3|nr:uncharacterized protein LOC123659460 [Melitaea cinxia]